MDTKQYIVYVMDDGSIFDRCDEFDTLSEAREYIKRLKTQDHDIVEYAIYLQIEIKIE